MSEFGKPESDQRLMGAPPGYIGYEAGGELIRAVKERPFSVILFDEIEKAHDSIFDKFLQILDDGQLTSGKGERVYFSEAVIIFTSNLGASGQLPQSTTFETLDERIRSKVREHFVEKMGRPELLNRLGENIIVFDLIRQGAAEEIVDKMLNNLIESSRERLNLTVTISAEARRAILEMSCRDGLAMGGRGIGNKIEDVVINQLGRYLVDKVPRPARINIDGLALDDGARLLIGAPVEASVGA
jgi:ATP-dependent Clp protease ATP-binding subunit ClpA